MAWVKLDDQAPRNHKVLQAGPSAAWMWVCGIAYCQSHLTDGFIPDVALAQIGIKGAVRARKLAGVLVSVGLFERVSSGCRPGDQLVSSACRPGDQQVSSGYRVHDYLEHNETREEALLRRVSLASKRAAAGRSGGLAKVANAKQTVVANPSPDPTRPDLTKNPLPPKGGRVLREDRKLAKTVLRNRFGRCHHDEPCESGAQCEAAIARELAERRTA